MGPLYVPAGALGNSSPLVLMAEQNVLVESDLAEEQFGDPFVLVPAMALEGVLGIWRMPPPEPQDVYGLSFERDEIVFTNGAALVFCPQQFERGTMPLHTVEAESDYRVLPLEAARMVAHDLDVISPEAMAGATARQGATYAA